mgnify:FL=1
MSADRLQQIHAALQKEEQYTLLRYAEFLLQSSEPVEQEKTEPLEIPRPQKEHVVKAIRRLAKTYPMLKHEKLLKQGADLMSAHLMNGRDAVEVIDELEGIFQAHYQRYLED